MKNNKSSIIIMLLMAVVLVAVMAVISDRQELRRSAHYAKGSLHLAPSEIEAEIGEEVSVILKAVPGVDEPIIQNVQALVCYDNNVLQIADTEDNAMQKIEIIDKEVFTEEPIIFFEEIANKSCVNLTAVTNKAGELSSKVVDVARFKFTTLAEGSGNIEIMKGDSVMSGYIANNMDKSIEITTVENASYVVSGAVVEPPAGEVPWLNFKMAFMGVNKQSSCAMNWPMTLTVLGDAGVSKVYSNVRGEVVSGTENPVIYEVSLPLTDFEDTENVAVLIKGPKHLQVKYAVDGQDEFYGKQGGELVLTKDKETSKVYDFTKYPLLAGDVTGKDGKQDGLINGMDFLYVRDAAIARGKDLPNLDKGDLDGNCVHNSLDVTWLMQALEERQEQIN